MLTQERKQWRHSFFGVYYNYSISQNKLTPIAKGEHLRNIKYAPDSKKIAYVKENNNLYIFDILKHKEKRLTRDGSETILNGYRGWLMKKNLDPLTDTAGRLTAKISYFSGKTSHM